MISQAIRALATGAVLAATVSGIACADDCKLVRIASFDFSPRSDGMIVVPVSLEGASVPMEVDTGSSVSVVDPALAQSLHLVSDDIVSNIMFNSVGEQYKRVATIHHLAIGTMQGGPIDMLIAPSPLTADGGISGLLGTDMLRQFDVDIDFGAGKLNLFSKYHCEGKVVYWPAQAVTVIPVHVLPDGQIIVPVTLDGHLFDTMLDTGSANTHLSLKAARDVFGLAPQSPGMTRVGSYGPGGTTPVYRHTFGSLSLQGIAFGHPTVHIMENIARVAVEQTSYLGSRLSHTDEAANVVDLGLGTDELRHLHIYIATKEQKLYVSAASAPAAVPSADAPPTTH